LNQTKSFGITKQQVWAAYKVVKANKGGAGVDGQTIVKFEGALKANLYKLSNRLASGSYMPPPVKRVEIPKSDGSTRPLGIPTVADRIAQTVVKHALEPELERHFHPDSYGYRPGKSAHQAIGEARKRCWRYDWVVDLDIKGFFDTIDHELLMRAVRCHTREKWVLRYIERWLKAPVQHRDGELQARDKGTPQGGVISPLLANLYVHYAFDKWMGRHYPDTPFERYADDRVCHCRKKEEAEQLKLALKERFAVCGLELHQEKTKVVYCKDGRRREAYGVISFDFLGYTYRPRGTKDRKGILFTGFNPAISKKATQAIVHEGRLWKIHLRSDETIEDLARKYNAMIRGWINDYGAFYRSALSRIFRNIECRLAKWAMRKYKSLKKSRWRAIKWLKRIARKHPRMFAHWQAQDVMTQDWIGRAG